MSNQAKEALLKMIREASDKLSIDGGDKQAFGSITKVIDKGTNYSFYVLGELLDFQSEKADSLSTEASKAIFDLIELALFTNTAKSDQNVHINKLTNFVSTKKDSELVGKIISIFDKNDGKQQMQLTRPELMFDLSESLIAYAAAKTDKLIVPFLVPYFKTGVSSESSLVKMLQSLRRTMRALVLKKRWELVNEILKTILTENSFELESPKVLDELFEIHVFIARYCHTESKTLKNASKLALKLSKAAKSKSNAQNGFVAFDRLFQFCDADQIEAPLLNELTAAFKKLDKSDNHHQKIARALTKVAISYSPKITKNEESFKAFHSLAIASFHVLASIKNEAGVQECCSNIKRHEVANLISTLISYASEFLLESSTLSAASASHIKYHLSYFIKIMSELECDSKDAEMKRMYNKVYNIIYHLCTYRNNVEHIRPIVENFFTILLKYDDLQEPMSLISSLYDQPLLGSLALECATGMACLFKYMSNRKTYDIKNLMKIALQVNKSSSMIGYKSGTDFIKSSDFKKLDYIKGSKIDVEEFAQFEICALTRYTQDTSVCTKLFNELSRKTEHPENLANCICLLDEKNFEGLNMQQYGDLLKRLENTKNFKIEVSLALAIGNYNIYIKMDSQYKQNKDGPRSFENMNIKTELEMLNHLVKAQKYFTDVIVHLKENPQEFKQIISLQRLVSIINNMAIQFYMRGIRLKEIETFTILWYYSHLDKPNPNKVLNTATFFIDNYQCLLDNSGNYLKFSKKLKPLTIEEIIVTANKIIQSEIKNFRTGTEEFQCIVLSYLISAWLFYFKKNRKTDALEQFELLKKLWNESKKPHISDPRHAVTSKLYFALFDANLVNFNRSADNFMSKANGFLLNSKNIQNEFCHQFYQIFYRVTMSNINYSLNRHNDLDHYESTIQSMIAMAQKKNYCLKILELLSLSISRNLNMEKMEVAQNQLRNISLVLGINEDILIESPIKYKEADAVTPTRYYEVPAARNGTYEPEGMMRKATVSSFDSPVNLELSIRHVDRHDLLLLQLKSFVHEEKCKCETCQYPQLKFYSFQLGCFYSRLLFLMQKFDVSANFHKFAIEPWRDVCDKLRRIKEYDNFLMINKNEFHIFSIRWLFQFADTLILKKEFELVDEVYQEIDLLLTNSIEDAECFRQTLFCRKENLNFLHENYKKFESPQTSNTLSFSDFTKLKSKTAPSKSPTETTTKTLKFKATKTDDAAKSSTKTPAGFVKIKKVDDPKKKKTLPPAIYIDISDDDSPPPKVISKPKPSSASSTSSGSSTSKPSSSRTKTSDQPAKAKKSSKDDKTDVAKKSTRPKMI